MPMIPIKGNVRLLRKQVQNQQQLNLSQDHEKILGTLGGRVSQKARHTLFVSGIPHKSNRIENLLSHFQKSGEVIDIYIPLNGEKAFVQFSKREAAEASLKASDAVMGNRFIKLWWANRDRIPEEGQDGGHINPVQYPGMVVTSVPPQPPAADREKASSLSAAQRGSSASAAETEVPITVLPKNLLANGPKATPLGKKQQENLELLKEVLRKKQEMLDQRRDDFRRQLHKLEKQVTGVPEVRSRSVNRAIIAELVRVYRETELGTSLPAYDGRKGLYTAGVLPFSLKECTIKLSEEDEGLGIPREKEYRVVIKFVAQADVHHMRRFIEGKQYDAPQDVLQVLDIVLKEISAKRYLSIGRCFYSPGIRKPQRLGDGLQCWCGF